MFRPEWMKPLDVTRTPPQPSPSLSATRIISAVGTVVSILARTMISPLLTRKMVSALTKGISMERKSLVLSPVRSMLPAPTVMEAFSGSRTTPSSIVRVPPSPLRVLICAQTVRPFAPMSSMSPPGISGSEPDVTSPVTVTCPPVCWTYSSK